VKQERRQLALRCGTIISGGGNDHGLSQSLVNSLVSSRQARIGAPGARLI
jgi:hypothetical protein